MNNDKLIAARCLIEAAELLNEASEAKKMRKELDKDLAKTLDGKNYKMVLFFEGNLNNEEAKKIYTKLKKELETLLTKVNDIPDDAGSDKVCGILATAISSLAVIGSFVLAFKGYMASLIGIYGGALGFAASLEMLSKKDINRSRAKTSIESMIKQVERTYTKYYETRKLKIEK